MTIQYSRPFRVVQNSSSYRRIVAYWTKTRAIVYGVFVVIVIILMAQQLSRQAASHSTTERRPSVFVGKGDINDQWKLHLTNRDDHSVSALRLGCDVSVRSTIVDTNYRWSKRSFDTPGNFTVGTCSK